VMYAVDGSACVAPPVGAWIEISVLADLRIPAFVAPPVGAWIEIWLRVLRVPQVLVAPPVGAWIEIVCCGQEILW